MANVGSFPVWVVQSGIKEELEYPYSKNQTEYGCSWLEVQLVFFAYFITTSLQFLAKGVYALGMQACHYEREGEPVDVWKVIVYGIVFVSAAFVLGFIKSN